MNLQDILNLIAQVTSLSRTLGTLVDRSREVLNDPDADRVNAALKELQDANDRLHQTVSRKLDDASKQG